MGDFLLAGVSDSVLITVCCATVVGFLMAFLTFTRATTNENSQTESTRFHRQESNQDVCPICLGAHVLAVETNCGHKFCGACMKDYLNRGSNDFSIFSGRASCPVCRQDINILLPLFLSDEMTSSELENERITVERTITDYNLCFGRGPRSLWNYIMDCPVLIRHMFFDFFTFGGLVWMFRVRVLLCCLGSIAYFFNPLDIIPEAVFGVFGFLDDVVVFLLCVIYISIIYRRVVISRAAAGT